MIKPRRLIWLSLLALGVLPGCVFGPATPPARDRPVEVPFGHVHNHDCGHFWAGNHWRHEHGHVHGPGCGHVLVDGRWSR